MNHRPLPDALVGALQDRIHPTSGRLLAAKRVWREGFWARVAAGEALLSGTAEDEPTPLTEQERVAETRGMR